MSRGSAPAPLSIPEPSAKGFRSLFRLGVFWHGGTSGSGWPCQVGGHGGGVKDLTIAPWGEVRPDLTWAWCNLDFRVQGGGTPLSDGFPILGLDGLPHLRDNGMDLSAEAVLTPNLLRS